MFRGHLIPQRTKLSKRRQKNFPLIPFSPSFRLKNRKLGINGGGFLSVHVSQDVMAIINQI